MEKNDGLERSETQKRQDLEQRLEEVEKLQQIARLDKSQKLDLSAQPIHTISKPGSNYRIIALMSLLFTLSSIWMESACLLRMNWVQTEAEVTDAWVVNGRRSNDWGCLGTFQYKSPNGFLTVEPRRLTSNEDEASAKKASVQLLHTVIHIHYDPQNPKDWSQDDTYQDSRSYVYALPLLILIFSATTWWALNAAIKAAKEVTDVEEIAEMPKGTSLLDDRYLKRRPGIAPIDE